MICVDASLVVRLVTRGATDETLVQTWTSWLHQGERLVAPTLLHFEVTNAIHRYRVAGELSPTQAAEVLDAALGLEIELRASAELHRRALTLARRFARQATYDAHYLAVAEETGADFWTGDRRLFNAVRDELTWVHLLESASGPPG